MKLRDRDVVDALADRGLQVTVRQLRSWRRHALLPALCRPGRGRGAGREGYWTTPRVVDQAQTVVNLLAMRRNASAALISLWLLGYDVATADARAVIAESLNERVALPLQALRKEEASLADCLDDLASHISRSNLMDGTPKE